ncbi:MAG: VanZ family protein [Rhizobiales bacterium]|nr:VanZ family protein [Hyphomicrobiales bacterium]
MKKTPNNERQRDARPYWRQALDLDAMRRIPFWMLAFLTTLVAYRAPYGRRPAEFDFDISWASIEWSLYKPLHIIMCAALMVLGVLAYKWKRWWLAALLTMLVGLSWEIAQMTVPGHNPRLADLAPDFLGVVLGWFIVEGIRHAMKPEDYIFG